MMIKILIRYLIMVLMLAAWAGCDREWTGNVSGQITDSITTTPVPGVVLTASSVKNDYSISDTTDENGEYRLDDLRWGPNSVTAYHPAYGSATKYADVIRDKTIDLDFLITREKEYINPVVPVTVLDRNDQPIANARVDLYHKDAELGIYAYLLTETTDASGTVSLEIPTLYEEEIEFFRLELSAFGFRNTTFDFSISWFVPEPELFVHMEPA
jgi:hypothetical protein